MASIIILLTVTIAPTCMTLYRTAEKFHWTKIHPTHLWQILHGIQCNFCPCSKDHHRLYIIWLTWDKDIVYMIKCKGWKVAKVFFRQKFLAIRYSHLNVEYVAWITSSHRQLLLLWQHLMISILWFSYITGIPFFFFSSEPTH